MTYFLNDPFSDSQYGFHAGRSTADVLTVISDRVYHALDISGEARAIALYIYLRQSIRCGMLVLYISLQLMVFQVPFWR